MSALPNDYVTVAQAAKLLRLTRQGVYHRLATGTLHADIFLGRRVIRKAQIDAETRSADLPPEDIGTKLGALLGAM